MEKQRLSLIGRRFLYNSIVTVGALSVATIISFYFHGVIYRSLNIALLYILAILVIGLLSSDYICGGVAALTSVILINYWFTYPFSKLDFSLSGYPMTFLVMLTLSLSISTIMIHLKEKTRILKEQEGQLIEAEKEKMRANLLRAVSHDLRTPLTSIIGAGNTYIENNSNLSEEEKLQLVSHILEDSNWLLEMVENLLSVTRIQNNAAKVKKSLEPVEEVVSEAVFRLKKRHPDSSIKVTVPDEFLMIPMDAMLIEQVIINLLENAIFHSQSTESIQCVVNYTDDQVSFHIIDYGVGIPEDRLDTIFDGSSYTQNLSSDSSKGMGIGLCICKTIIVAHNGTITARNHGRGAEFIFTLPREGKTTNPTGQAVSPLPVKVNER